MDENIKYYLRKTGCFVWQDVQEQQKLKAVLTELIVSDTEKQMAKLIGEPTTNAFFDSLIEDGEPKQRELLLGIRYHYLTKGFVSPRQYALLKGVCEKQGKLWQPGLLLDRSKSDGR